VDRQAHRRGFGTTVMESSIVQQLGGTVRLDWRPAGLACEINVPAEQLMENEDPIRITPDRA
jgi:two-component sensor histidine kinase